MSILLDALRKSEKQQQRGEINTLHLGTLTDPVPEPTPMGWLALLLVVALFVNGWSVWRQYRIPEGSYRPPVTLAADQPQAASTPSSTSQAGDAKRPATASANVANDKQVAGGSRTPVESFQPAATKATVGQADSNATRAVAGVSGAAKPAVNKPAVIQSEVPAQKKLPAPIPAPISYWELPDAVRARVPEMQFSVLVYAKKPAERFVLIGGQRLKEGDSYRAGLVVHEIRRDGVIFKYRLYQFLVER